MSVANPDETAISVVNANVKYGKHMVLNNCCMNVPRGCIYGLLGASGCGKTTLLNCLVGRKTLNAGDIFVLGGKPGTNGLGIPGPRMGYMPQDISLIMSFSVKYTILFFGRILGMEDEQILERIKVLQHLLDLPPCNRLVKNCSGGQQRRVSLAIALVHKPELLLLDEPTVGLDPELRDIIWGHLVKIAEEEGTTIIITTHYIEEARQAHKIGLMRGGQLLVEESPDRLLQLFSTDNLEEVFLILSKAQTDGQLDDILNNYDTNNTLQTINDSNFTYSHPKSDYKATKGKINSGTFNKFRLKSMLSKNMLQLIGNPSFLFLAILLPIIEILCFWFCIGGDPRSTAIAVINDEKSSNCSNYRRIDTAVPFSSSSCNFTNLSCRFIEDMPDSMINFLFYDNVDDAKNDVQHGTLVGVIYIPELYSDALTNRVNNHTHASDEDVDFSIIKVWLDMSNQQIGTIVKRRLFKRYQTFLTELFSDCDYPKNVGKLPLHFNFEYGSDSDPYINFMIPGLLQSIMFFLGSQVTGGLLILERTEGIWDRLYHVGVTSSEIYIAHFFTDLFLVLLQVLETIVVTFIFCGVEYLGEMWIIFLLLFAQGICGMTFGFFISGVSVDHTMGTLLITSVFLPLLFLSDLIWPLEGQPEILRHISTYLPFTLSTNSIRQVLNKGSKIYDLAVIIGFGSLVTWIVIFTALSIVIIRARR